MRVQTLSLWLALQLAGSLVVLSQQVIRVPQEVADLQRAIGQVRDGGVIEMTAGVYPVPNAGFSIRNARKSFTIRAAANAEVVLDGGGSRPVLRFLNNDSSQEKLVVFEDLVFRNGLSTEQSVAGGVTVVRAHARFVRSRFENNRRDASGTGGGGVVVFDGAEAVFQHCEWTGNTASDRGGGLSVASASASVLGGRFEDNRVNLPGHLRTAAGGAIYVLDSTLNVSETLFRDNRAAWVGGAIYAFGSWKEPVSPPGSEVVIVGSTFVGNLAEPDSCCAPPGRTGGGAVHLEDHTSLRILTSQFVENRAEEGGAVSNYRAVLEIRDALFLGNEALGGGGAAAGGGAIRLTSADFADSSTDFGAINRRPAELDIADTYFQGRFRSLGTVATTGGCLSIDGDITRMYGEGGVAQNGTAEDNRARARLRRVIFSDCDVEGPPAAVGGTGGAIGLNLTDLTLEDSLIVNCDAYSGGGLSATMESHAVISGTTFARNTAEQAGGGMSVGGSTVQVSDSIFIENEVSPGEAETEATSLGAAIRTRPFSSGPATPNRPSRHVDGEVADSIFSRNVGIAISDNEIEDGPTNDVRYNGNRFFATTFGSKVYNHNLAARNGLSAVGLNNLIVRRSNGTSTDKSLRANTSSGNPIQAGALRAAPVLIPVPVSVDVDASSILAYAWSGASARLNGESLLDTVGMREVPEPGDFELSVNDTVVATAVTRSGEGFLYSELYPDFRFRVQILADSSSLLGSQELDCIEQTICVSGALEGRSELFIRIIGPRPNGFLWVQLVRFTPSEVEVEIEQLSTGARNTYTLAALPRTSDDLTGLMDRTAFLPSGGVTGTATGAQAKAPEVVFMNPGPGALREEAGARMFETLALQAGAAGFSGERARFTSPAIPGFRFDVQISPPSGGSFPGSQEAECIDETVCVSGAVGGRSELFIRIIGPRPNGLLWVQLVRFTPSRVDVEIEQLATGVTRSYVLEGLAPTSDELGGLVDREAFSP